MSRVSRACAVAYRLEREAPSSATRRSSQGLAPEPAPAWPEPLPPPPPLLPDGAQEKARAQEQERGDIGLQALHHAPRQVFGSTEPAGELETGHHESGHDPFAKPVAPRDDRDEGEGGIGLPAQKADVVRQEEDIDDGEQDDPAAELEEISVDAVGGAAHPALTAPGRRPARRTGARPCPGQWTGPRSIVPPAATTIRSARSSRPTPGPRWRRRRPARSRRQRASRRARDGNGTR